MLLKTICFVICSFLSVFFVLNILIYSFDFVLQSPYTCESYTMVLKSRKFSIIFMLPTLLFVLFLTVKDTNELLNEIRKLPVCIYIMCIGVAFLLWQYVDSCDEIQSKAHETEHLINDLNYGKGMAYSYFYGYLKFVLPSTGTSIKGIAEKINDYEDYHNIKFSVKKLFIIIPSSQFIPPNLSELSDGWMESVGSLEDETRTRAGVVNRQYRNTVYKIYPDGRRDMTPKYIIAEGATPVLTFFEVQKHSHPETELYKKYNLAIVNEFTNKLEELLQGNPECRDVSEIIFYEDSNRRVNVAQIILDRINRTKTSLRE